MIATATGQEPLVAGKPEPPLHAESVARTGAQRPLVVGDRLDTDIEGAVRVGADSMLVLTGVTQPGRRGAGAAPPAARLPGARPVRAARAAPAGHRGRRRLQCGGWHARWQPPRLVLGGGGDPMDGLRALCAASWAADGVTAAAVAPALPHLGW